MRSILFLIFLQAEPEPSSPPLTSEPPAAAVRLADWGLEAAAQIGYVEAGLVHKPAGPELVVYDVRRARPLIPPPEGPRGRVPEHEGGLFMVATFDRSNRNALGGCFGAFAREPSHAEASLAGAPGAPHSLSLRFHRASAAPTGLWVHLFDSTAPPADRWYLDVTPFEFLTFAVRGRRGGEMLTVRLADRALDEREDSAALGPLNQFLEGGNLPRGWARAWVPLAALPASINRTELATLALEPAADGDGEIHVKDLAFTQSKAFHAPRTPSRVRTTRSPRKALWVWDTSGLLSNRKARADLLRLCAKRRITDLFLQLPYQAEKNEEGWDVRWEGDAVADLVSQLHRARLRVHALDGDPSFALEEKHGLVEATVRNLLDYNRSAAPRERFDGLRYDIEFYLLPGARGVRRDGFQRQFLTVLGRAAALAREAGLTIGADIPFWYDARNAFGEPTSELEGKPLSEWVLDTVDEVAVMDYRTVAYGPDGTLAHVAGELDYADRTGKTVLVGLETSELPDETHLEFGPGGQGPRLFLLPGGEGIARLVFDAGPGAAEDPAPALRATSSVFIPSGKVSYWGKSHLDLDRTIEQTLRELGSHPGFAGFALHSYEGYRTFERARAKAR